MEIAMHNFPQAINFPRLSKILGGAFNFDPLSVEIVHPVIMTCVWYPSPYCIHGYFYIKKGEVGYFVGYKCEECGEVFLVPDTVEENGEFHNAMIHKCMEAI